MNFPSRFTIRAFLGRTKAERRATIKEVAYKRRYVLPNLVTMGNMFCGYLAIMYSVTDRIGLAFWSILVALLLDGLDGRVARKLNATSPFGMELDSFADLVSFGVAPGVMMYHWAMFPQADRFGLFITFIYVTCAASRLARFNISTADLTGFTGLPSPGAAGAVIALIHFIGVDNHAVKNDPLILWACSIAMVAIGILMVSRTSFISIKTLNFKSAHFLVQFITASLLGLVWYNHRIGLFLIAYLYLISGPVKAIIARPKLRFR